MQHVHLLLGEVTPAATLQILLGETGKIDAVELDYPVTQSLENTTHDAVTARVNLDAHLVLVGFIGIAHGVGLYESVLQFDTVGNALHILLVHVAVEPHVIDFLLDELGVRELRGEVAVVGG